MHPIFIIRQNIPFFPIDYGICKRKSENNLICKKTSRKYSKFQFANSFFFIPFTLYKFVETIYWFIPRENKNGKKEGWRIKKCLKIQTTKEDKEDDSHFI